jgi:hypothetical protein
MRGHSEVSRTHTEVGRKFILTWTGKQTRERNGVYRMARKRGVSGVREVAGGCKV